MPLGYSSWSRFSQVLAVFALDASRDASAAGFQHQHQVAAGERDESGEGRALVAALFLLDLDQQVVAIADGVWSPDARVSAFAEVVLGDFLERQEAVWSSP